MLFALSQLQQYRAKFKRVGLGLRQVSMKVVAAGGGRANEGFFSFGCAGSSLLLGFSLIAASGG